jgi:hypothetical protein
MNAAPAPRGVITVWRAESLLQAWGLHRRREFEDEVGLPGVSPSCSGYESPPEWGEQPPAPVVTAEEIDQVIAVMALMSRRYRRLYRDLREHYVDGRKLGWQVLDRGRHLFCTIWCYGEAPGRFH